MVRRRDRVNIKRYVIAGGLSFAAHAALVVVMQEPKAFAMPVGSQSNSVSLNFKTMASVTPSVEPATQPVTKNQAKPVEAAPAKAKKIVKQPTTKPKKAVASQPAQSVVKKQRVVSKPKPQQTVNRKPESQRPTKPIAESKHPPTNVKAPSQVVNKGITSQPVMLTKASFLNRPAPPKYPRMAKKRGIEGVVMYEVWLDESGNQVKQVLISSSGATILDKSALEAIKKWQFSPQSIDGQRVAHRIQIPVRFKLDR